MTFRFFVLFVCLIILTSALASAWVTWAMRRARPAQSRRGRKKAQEWVPEGGGLVVIPPMSLGWLVCAILGVAPSGASVAAAAMIGLAAISVRDMRVGIPALYRYTAQAIAVVVGLIFLPGAGQVFQGWLLVTIDLILATLLWIGAMRVMPWCDRMEGTTAIRATSIGLGSALVAMLSADPGSGALGLGVCTASVALGYLPWAWPPSRLRLGKVGTIPLGYGLAWLLLGLAGRGHWASALILASPYLGDVAWALRRRFAPAHESPRPADPRQKPPKGPSPLGVLKRRLAADAILVALAGLGAIWPWPALLAAIVVVARLMRSLAGLSGLGFRGR